MKRPLRGVVTKGLYPKYFVDHTILMYKDVKTKDGKLITRYQTQSPSFTYTSKHFRIVSCIPRRERKRAENNLN